MEVMLGYHFKVSDAIGNHLKGTVVILKDHFEGSNAKRPLQSFNRPGRRPGGSKWVIKK